MYISLSHRNVRVSNWRCYTCISTTTRLQWLLWCVHKLSNSVIGNHEILRGLTELAWNGELGSCISSEAVFSDSEQNGGATQ